VLREPEICGLWLVQLDIGRPKSKPAQNVKEPVWNLSKSDDVGKRFAIAANNADRQVMLSLQIYRL
jgi:hypothetical protein